MNKSALKSFATSARKELLKKVEAKALKLGITAEAIKKAEIESSDAIFIDGRQLSKEEKIQRDNLIDRIHQIGFHQVIEEVAYTWFNRFSALRYMEVNDYLPTKVRVLSSINPDSNEPDMIKEALSLDLDLDKEKIYGWKINNQTEELFKYLIIKHCNDLNRYMPFMFETIDDYTEILFPEGLLATESFVRQITNTQIISEDDWKEIEIIGWLYQFYNTEMNELVYDGNMSKSRIPKELLPAATQLFTPDWAVKYMVENSLGSLWLEGYTDTDLKQRWKYYLDNTETNVNKMLINNLNYKSPEDIKILDPAMGSGHILVYAFEVLMDIYQSCGYSQRDAAKLILQKNLYGLEIDDRAYQLACFAVVMKARKYNRRLFSENIELNLCSIQESNSLNNQDIVNIKDYVEDRDFETLTYIIEVFKNAKEYGSILNLEIKDYDSLGKSLINIKENEINDLFQSQLINEISEIIPKLIKQTKIMTDKYDVVITNPPYLGNSRMSTLLNDYVKNNYPNTKSDLSMVMYQKAIDSYSKQFGYISYITTTSWMYLKSFEEFRKKLLETIEFTSLVDYGTELFDGKVGHNPIVSWVNRNCIGKNNMIAIRLVDFCYSKRTQKESEYFNFKNKYYPKQKDFTKIQGSPIAYWASQKFINNFKRGKSIDFFSTAMVSGNKTANNERFLRFNWEVSSKKINNKWFHYAKGGEFRKWYGNIENVIDWSDKAKDFYKKNGSSNIIKEEYWFKQGLTYTDLTSKAFSCRLLKKDMLFDMSGPGILFDNNTLYYVMGVLNSNIANEYFKAINTTFHFKLNDINRIPIIIDNKKINEVEMLVQQSITISKIDWDNYEISNDFSMHPIIKLKNMTNKIETAFNNWKLFSEKQFSQLKFNEERLNHILIDIYDLKEELTPKVEDKDITIRIANLERDMKSFISYAIGCSFGRFSLDEEGLIFAGGEFNPLRYQTVKADKDNILPILSGPYFEDDIVSRFVKFVQVTFGEETLVENLEFIADTLGKKKGETSKETIRRYFLNDFFKNHVQTYKKRPIYWLFTSGKEKAFNCLIYMHRYDKTTLSRIRTDYLHEYQIRLDAEKRDLLNIIEGESSTKEISNAKKELKSLDKKIEELKEYDELLHHMADMQIEIDLDDGVAVNYEKFKGLVAKIK